jgi:hypothetical protein
MNNKPFDTGSQYGDWVRMNCSRCKRGYYNNGERFVCDIELAINDAYLSNGYVSENIARRMGAIGHNQYLWRCPEFEGVE